jgi:hypothetical protein
MLVIALLLIVYELAVLGWLLWCSVRRRPHPTRQVLTLFAVGIPVFLALDLLSSWFR